MTVEPPAEGLGDPRRVLHAAMVLAGVTLAIFAAGIVIGFVIIGRHGGGPIQGWDDSVGHWYLHHRGSLLGISKVVATYFDAFPLGIICVVLTAILAVTLRTSRALIPIVAYVGGEFQVFAIRTVIHRHRPPTANYPAAGAVNGVHETSYSFPSGHSVAVTAVLFGLFGCIALTYRIWWPWLIALIGSVFVIDTRLVLGVHWLSDVTIGLLMGAAWGVSVAFVGRQVEWDDFLALVHSGRERPATSEPRSGTDRS